MINVLFFSGTVQGHGYDCATGKVNKFEDSDNGVWNRVRISLEEVQILLEQSKNFAGTGTRAGNKVGDPFYPTTP